MYKSHSIWDEENEKHDNIRAKDEDKQDYHHQRDYAAGGANPSDVYNTNKGEERKKEDETGIEREVAKEEKKYERKEGPSEEEIKRKAASEVHQEAKSEDKKKDKKAHKSIEDAIKKAIKEEKELIYLQE